MRAVEVCIANKLTVENVCPIVLLCRKYNLVGLELGKNLLAPADLDTCQRKISNLREQISV
jgi:hypothetical protein